MKKQPRAPTLREVFASNLRALRRAKDISQEELAGLAGLSRTYVSSVERADRNISVDNVGKLAEALGTPAMVLFDPTLIDRLRNGL
jgi:transcriptional regulator with XRE-family HTH domain